MGYAEQRAIKLLEERFPFLEDTLISPKPGRISTLPLNRTVFEYVFIFVVESAGFTTFHLIIGVDDGENLGFIYVLSNADKVMLLLKQAAPKTNPAIRSICGTFPNALWHERELVDLFGAVVENLPPGPSYPLPDDWPQGNYPLRKEWKVEYFDRETMTYNPPPDAVEQEVGHE